MIWYIGCDEQALELAWTQFLSPQDTCVVGHY